MLTSSHFVLLIFIGKMIIAVFRACLSFGYSFATVCMVFMLSRAIEALWDFLPENAVKSIVVFSGKAEFKTAMPKNVVYLKDLPNYLSSFTDELLSINRVQFCLGRIEFERMAQSAATEKIHLNNLKSKALN